MTEQDNEFWSKAADARAELVEQYAEDPNVLLIDIGYPPTACDDDEVVLRIHMSEEWCAENLPEQADFQAEVDGIPVYVICDDVISDDAKSN